MNKAIICNLDLIPRCLSLDGSMIKVLMLCWKNGMVTEDDNTLIVNNQAFRQKAKEDWPEAKDSTINKAIHYLCKDGSLLRQAKGMYVLNPELYVRVQATFNNK